MKVSEEKIYEIQWGLQKVRITEELQQGSNK